MMLGTITAWKEAGYGFIRPDDGSQDWFCHRNAIEGHDCAVPGQRVSFEPGRSPKTGREAAQNVKLLEPLLHKVADDDLDDATAHMQLGQTEFMRRRYD